MQSEFKLYKTLLTLKREQRANHARFLLLKVYNALMEKGVAPTTRMKGLEYCVFAPLVYDGPLNEKELEFANTALNQSFSLEEANDIAKHINLEETSETIGDFANVLEEKYIDDLLDMIVLGFVSDSIDDTINEKEDQLLNEIQLKVYFK